MKVQTFVSRQSTKIKYLLHVCSIIDRVSVEMIYLCFTMTTLRYSKHPRNLNKIYSQPGTVLYHKSRVR